MSKLKENKAYRIVKTILNIVIGAFLVLFLIAVCLQRFSGNKLSIFNYRMFTVASGSMEPKYKIGDVLIAKEVAPEDIKVGDAVSYLGRSGDFKDKVITHEVIEIETDADGKRVFHTQGLANIIEDPIVYENQIYGVVKYKPVLLSLVYRTINAKYGMLIIVIPILYIVGSEVLSLLLEKEEKKREKRN